MSLLDLLNEIDNDNPIDPPKILKAPMGYPGGKSRIVQHILPLLPYRGVYVEPFGGSGAVLLARRASKLDVYNDRYGGIVSFYRCLQNPKLLDALIERLKYTIHSREDWHYCKETWDCDWLDPVERASRWYYMLRYSFAGKGGAFGRSTSAASNLSGKIQQSLPYFYPLHQRLQSVQIENRDWRTILHDYDGPDVVFYLDPPYLACTDQTYQAMGGPTFRYEDHAELISTIFTLRGFVALSGYANPLYDQQDWDGVHQWDAYVSMDQGKGGERTTNKETLYIKEAC